MGKKNKKKPGEGGTVKKTKTKKERPSLTEGGAGRQGGVGEEKKEGSRRKPRTKKRSGLLSRNVEKNVDEKTRTVATNEEGKIKKSAALRKSLKGKKNGK